MDSPTEGSAVPDQRAGDGDEGAISDARKPSFYLARAALAGATLYFVLELSSGDRGSVDYVVITLVVGSVLYNFCMAGRLLRKDASHQSGT